jgi:hypothetical protein
VKLGRENVLRVVRGRVRVDDGVLLEGTIGVADDELGVGTGTLLVDETLPLDTSLLLDGTIRVADDELLLEGTIGVADDGLGLVTGRLSVDETLLLTDDDDAKLVRDGNTGVEEDVKFDHDDVDRAVDDRTGGTKYPLVVEFRGRLDIVVGWISEDVLVIVQDVELVVEVTAGVELMGEVLVSVPHFERDVLELLP